MTGHQIVYPEYENFLDSMKRQGGAFKFIAARKHFPIGSKVGEPPRSRTLAQIEKSVMESSRVKNVITEESIRRKCAIDEVRREALDLLKEMAHQYNLWNVRALGYFVCSTLEKLYDGIYVNERQLEKIRERSKTDPIVFMPSHKTYFDFILLSLICFDYNIQLPAIAAGQDFMSMKFIGEVLRRSGAFFMRRSFGNDKLYWAVFSEYVQTHVINNDRSVEFFVEATRSRVGKSLHPKYGMMQIILEPYLRGSVFDLVVVPVSMNYDQILEEKLYAYELLGFPKPKESTSGLLKAREILNKKHGSCFLTFGEPISVRNYFGVSLHRNTFVCQPDSQFVLDQQAKIAIRKFAHYIVEKHNENSVITIWNVACTVILKTLDDNDDFVFQYDDLHLKVGDLVHLLKQIGVTVNVRKDLDNDLRYYLELHNDLFHPFDLNASNFHLKLLDYPVAADATHIPVSIMERSVSRLILTTYSNGLIHAIDSEGILCTLLLKKSVANIEIVKTEFCWLHEIMKREFVSIPGELDKLFQKTLNILKNAEIVGVAGDTIKLIDTFIGNQLANYIQPYFIHFETIIDSIDDSMCTMPNINKYIQIVQRKIADFYNNNRNKVRLSFLSTEPIKNAITVLAENGAITKTETGFDVHSDVLAQIRKRLSNFSGSTAVFSSKL
ncbi:unnamed protein product [Caenorhabditis bovis]|uniref:Phospholipid/glycerol acyltransferase domain-containing protein n=1 Tax=Caenorhabditis bovis TaxID=2654633 RepID=A0A8S1EUL3_9PELO|nr:unnamed protein product [Caenorhabditis bovis]